LRARIGDMNAAHLLDFFQECGVGQDGQAQVLPILAFAARNHVVNGRKAQLLMMEMPVNHELSRLSSKSGVIPTHPTGDVNSVFPPQGQSLRRGLSLRIMGGSSARRRSFSAIRRCNSSALFTTGPE